MLKISDDHAAAFEQLLLVDAALRAKFAGFSATMQQEHEALLTRSRELWAIVMAAHGLDGVWRYEDGKLHPYPAPTADQMPATRSVIDASLTAKDGASPHAVPPVGGQITN